MNAVIRFRPLLFHMATPAAAGAFSLRAGTGGAYELLDLPPIAPPKAVLEAAVICLYLLMGLSAYLVTTSKGIARQERVPVLSLYAWMVAMHILWGFLFFYFRFLTLSALWTIPLFAVTALCSALFYRIRRTAGLALIPAAAWPVFLGALGFWTAAIN